MATARGALALGICVLLTLSVANAAFAADDDDLGVAVLGLAPLDATFTTNCQGGRATGKMPIESLFPAGHVVTSSEREAIEREGFVYYRQVWCSTDGRVVEVRAASGVSRGFGAAIVAAMEQVHGTSFPVPITGATGKSVTDTRNDLVVHTVAFTRGDRFFAASGYSAIDADGAPAMRDAIALAQRLDVVASDLPVRNPGPTLWQYLFAVVAIGLAATAVVGGVIALRRRNDRSDAVRLATKATRSSDPLGFG